MHRYLCVLALVMLAGCGGSANVEEERNALLSLDRDWSQTATDPEKFVTFLATDVTMYPPGMPALRGTDAIRKTFSEMTAAPGFALSWTPTRADVAASGDLGTTVGTYEMSMAGSSEKGKYVTVWRKQADGSWKVVDDIFNADAPTQPSAGEHVMLDTGALKWADAPPTLPRGARVAVVSGDPAQAQPFVLRLQVPAGYRVAPHWHPGVENVTVLSGTVALGMGEQFDESKMTTLPSGGYASMPAEMRHYFLSRSASTIQVHGMGPFAVNYVNAADDPSKQQ